MRFYPPENKEIDLITEPSYIKNILSSWREGLNLVSRYDLIHNKLYHIFMHAYKPDINMGIFRVWTKKSLIEILSKIDNGVFDNRSIFDKLDMLDRVFNRGGKLYEELTNKENVKIYENMMFNAKENFNNGNYIMAAYFAKGALMYKQSHEANELLDKCRDNVVCRNAA